MTYIPTAPFLPDPVRQPGFYAGVVVKRGLAWVVDTVLIGLVVALIVPFTAFTALLILPFLMALIGFLYRWATLATGSATWGMRLFAIQLRDRMGQRLSGQDAFLHTLGYTVSMVMMPLQIVSILLMLLGDRRQGLTDHILGTVLINKPL